MCNQNRLGALRVGVGGHRGAICFLGMQQKDLQPVGEQGLQLIDGGTNVQPQVGGNLLVAAAAAVELVAGVSDQRH